MRKIITVTAAASLAINTFMVLNGRGNFIYTFLPMAASLWIGLPLILVSAIIFAVAAKRGNNNIRSFGTIGFCICIIIFSTLISIPFGKLLLKRDIMAATTFCDSLVPELDMLQKRTGSYPKNLSELTKHKKSPRLLAGQTYYVSDGISFHFSIADPSTVMGGVALSSLNRKWSRWD